LSLYLTTDKGTLGIKLLSDDSLAQVLTVNQQNIGLMTKKGFFKIIVTNSITAIGKLTQGIKGIKLEDDDELLCAQCIDDIHTNLLLITQTGTALNIDMNTLKPMSTAAKGRVLHKDEPMNFILFSSQDKSITIITSLNTYKFDISTLESATKLLTLQKNEQILEVTKN